MSFEQEVPYEPIIEVKKKSNVAKKAMAEAIAAKWLSMYQNPQEIYTTQQQSPKISQVKKKFKLIEDPIIRKYPRTTRNWKNCGPNHNP